MAPRLYWKNYITNPWLWEKEYVAESSFRNSIGQDNFKESLLIVFALYRKHERLESVGKVLETLVSTDINTQSVSEIMEFLKMEKSPEKRTESVQQFGVHLEE